LHVPVRYRIPDDQPLATHTINRGVPLVMSHSSSALARSVLGFATELQRDVAAQGTAGAQPAPAAASGPLSRLLGRLARGRGGAA
jgi:pilus assembly protein CpaE